MEILIGISLLINLVFAFGCALLVNSEKTEKKDILNRLMAKDYKEYANYEHIKDVTKKEDVKPSVFENDIYPVN